MSALAGPLHPPPPVQTERFDIVEADPHDGQKEPEAM